jgi:SAM-dependent methyltransferase
MGPVDPTARFSDRVADYVQYRPGYPDALLEALQGEIGLSSGSVVADIGSGTGISSELLLRTGCTVFSVEPNLDMTCFHRRMHPDPRTQTMRGCSPR